MSSIELFQNLANAFHHTWASGYHNQVTVDLNSELVGLFPIAWVSKSTTFWKSQIQAYKPYLTTYSKHYKRGLWWSLMVQSFYLPSSLPSFLSYFLTLRKSQC